MEIRRICRASISKAQFDQIVRMEAENYDEPYSPQMLTSCLDELDTFACLEEDRILGFITLQSRSTYLGGSIYLVNLNVAKSRRRMGIGRELVRFAYCAVASGSAEAMASLDVDKRNAAAQRLYQQLGFEPVEIPSRNGDTDLVMAAPVSRILESCCAVQRRNFFDF